MVRQGGGNSSSGVAALPAVLKLNTGVFLYSVMSERCQQHYAHVAHITPRTLQLVAAWSVGVSCIRNLSARHLRVGISRPCYSQLFGNIARIKHVLVETTHPSHRLCGPYVKCNTPLSFLVYQEHVWLCSRRSWIAYL